MFSFTLRPPGYLQNHDLVDNLHYMLYANMILFAIVTITKLEFKFIHAF